MTSTFAKYSTAEKLSHQQLHIERTLRLRDALKTFQVKFERTSLESVRSLSAADPRATVLAPLLLTHLCGDTVDQELAHELARYVYILTDILDKSACVPNATRQQLEDDASMFIAKQGEKFVASRGIGATWNEIGGLDNVVLLSIQESGLSFEFKSGFSIEGKTNFLLSLDEFVAVEIDGRAKQTRRSGSALFRLRTNPRSADESLSPVRKWLEQHTLSVDSASDALSFIFTLRKLREHFGFGVITIFSSAHLKRNRNNMRNLRFVITFQYLAPLGNGMQAATVKQIEVHSATMLKRLLAVATVASGM